MARTDPLRRHVLYLLDGGGAHLPIQQAVRGLPAKLRGVRPYGLPFTAWRLLEHLRIAQWDILEYCRNPRHRSPEFPRGYWPTADSPGSTQAWRRSLQAFERDLKAIKALVVDPGNDLLAPIPHGIDGHTLLREALLVADHNAYHMGQLILLRRMLGAWPESAA
jgi:hypothetical protein